MVEVVLYGVVAVYLLAAHSAPLRVRSVHPAVYFAALLIGLMVLSLSYTPYPQYALVRVGQMVVLFSLTAVAASKATRAEFHLLAHCFLALVAVSIAYGIAFPSVPINQRQAGRFTWLAIHPTVSGIITGLATVVALAYVTAGRRRRPGPNWRMPVYVGLLVVNGGALLETRTRGAIAAALAGALVVLLTSRRSLKSMVDLVLGTMVVVTAAALLFFDTVASYFIRGETTDQLVSLNSRTDLWATALRAFADEPIFGYGVTSSRGLFYAETGLGGGHNAAVNVLVELGVVGAIVWMTLLGLVLKEIWGLPRDGSDQLITDRSLLLGVMAFLVVNGLFFEGIGSVTNIASTWFFLCLAWALVAQRSSRANPPAPRSTARVARARPV